MNFLHWPTSLERATIALITCAASLAGAGEIGVAAGDPRAHRNYLLHCVGCHQADGSGAPAKGVPSFKGSLARFLYVPGGREYIVQVPGVMNSGLNDRDVADLMNWLLPRVASETTPKDMMPYTSDEIARLRNSRPIDFAATRRDLLLHAQ